MRLAVLEMLLDLVVLAWSLGDEEIRPVPTVDGMCDPAGEFEHGR